MPERRRDDLERLLGDALEQSDPIPPGLVEAAGSLFDFIDVDGSLATLLDTEAAAVRNPGVRQRVFAWPDGDELTVQLSPTEDGSALTGLVELHDEDQPTELSARVQTAAGGDSDLALSRGSFETSVGPEDHWRIVLTIDGRRLVTPWMGPDDDR